MQEDEDLAKDDLIEAQETAGFHEIDLRHAIGCHFNHLFLWGIIKPESQISVKEPTGSVSKCISKNKKSYTVERSY